VQALPTEGRDMRSITVLALAVLFVAVPAAAQAQWETEADPIAFALHGFSLHVAHELPGGRERLQIGVFGADVPASWLPHEFTERSRGITMKVDYFLGHRPAGVFIGVDGDYSREDYALKNGRDSTARNLFALGPRVGYRIDVGRHFYLTPWLSAGYQFNVHDDVVISGERFDQKKYSIFATVHAGWRF
jgi:hypothetical protein